MKARNSLWILIIGLVLSITSIGAAFLKWGLWYLPATIGVWFVFDYFSSIKNKNTAIQIFKNNKLQFFKLFFVMLLLGSAIEVFGRFILNLWIYPFQTNIWLDIVGILVYPFILFSFREMYETIKLFLKKSLHSFIGAMLLGIILWEIPNLFIFSWIYTIPFIKLNIVGINIVVIIGWFILILFPIFIYNEFFPKIKKKK